MTRARMPYYDLPSGSMLITTRGEVAGETAETLGLVMNRNSQQLPCLFDREFRQEVPVGDGGGVLRLGVRGRGDAVGGVRRGCVGRRRNLRLGETGSDRALGSHVEIESPS
jgi:hypothetical protein